MSVRTILIIWALAMLVIWADATAEKRERERQEREAADMEARIASLQADVQAGKQRLNAERIAKFRADACAAFTESTQAIRDRMETNAAFEQIVAGLGEDS